MEESHWEGYSDVSQSSPTGDQAEAEDGDWAILEWRDPDGLRGCGFFNVIDGRIHFQRGYWDRLSFLRQQGLPIPDERA